MIGKASSGQPVTQNLAQPAAQEERETKSLAAETSRLAQHYERQRAISMAIYGLSVLAFVVLVYAFPAFGARLGMAGKTLWDWLELLVVPLALAVVAYLFNQRQKAHERAIAHEQRAVERELAREQREAERRLARHRLEETDLQNYFERMATLLLEENLRQSDQSAEVRTIARTYTLTALRNLNGPRRSNLLRFLYEARLIVGTAASPSVIDMHEADLRTIQLDGTPLNEIALVGANLEQASLRATSLVRANLGSARLLGANLELASLRRAILRDANLEAANLRRANLWGANLGGAALTGAVLSGAALNGADLQFADLQAAVLIGADLQRASLQGAILLEANLQGGNLARAHLARASLVQANLAEANLTGADLTGADLQAAILLDAQMQGAQLDGAIYNDQTAWPADFVPPASAIHAPGAPAGHPQQNRR